MIDALSFNTVQQESMLNKKPSKAEEANTTFLGHVLSTLLEDMIPKEGYLEDGNAQIFFSMYFADLMESPEMIKSFGLEEELYVKS